MQSFRDFLTERSKRSDYGKKGGQEGLRKSATLQEGTRNEDF